VRPLTRGLGGLGAASSASIRHSNGAPNNATLEAFYFCLMRNAEPAVDPTIEVAKDEPSGIKIEMSGMVFSSV